MGFRKDSYATVWEVKPRSDTMTSARISVNKKNRQTGEYVQEFGGYVAFLGTACAKKAARLKAKDRIKLGDVDVVNKYDAERKTTYTNFNVYSFEIDGEQENANPQVATPDNRFYEGDLSDDLPF